MRLGYTHFDGQADAEYVRITLTPQDQVKLIPGKKIVPVLRFRKQKKQPDEPFYITGERLQEWIAMLAAHKFEYVCVGSEMNDSSQWAGSIDEYIALLTVISVLWKEKDPATKICDGGLQGHAIAKNKVDGWKDVWTISDRPNFHHFQDVKSIEGTVETIRRSTTAKPLICSAAGVKKSVGKKTTMTAKINEMQRLGIELLIWFSGDGDDSNTNLWTLPKHLREFNAAYASLQGKR